MYFTAELHRTHSLFLSNLILSHCVLFLNFLMVYFLLGSDKDPLLWVSASRWSSSWKEHSVIFGEESAAVLRSVESLQNHSPALWRPVHAGVLHQLWVRSLGEDTGWLGLNVTLEFWRRVWFNGFFFSQEEDALVRWMSILNNVADQLYYPCEHIAWAADAELIKTKSDKWWVLSTGLWGISLILNILR